MESMSSMQTVAERTLYPEVFGDTYWGAFVSSENPAITDTIISNRNRFAETYQLERRFRDYDFTSLLEYSSSYLFVGEPPHWDHMEYYYTRSSEDPVVIVTSHYGNSEAFADTMVSLGFSIHSPIYSKKATTFVKRFHSRADMTEFAKNYHRLACRECGQFRCHKMASYLRQEEEENSRREQNSESY
jgi:hypothetical protein